MVPVDITNKNFSRTRIYIAWTGGVGYIACDVSYAVVSYVIRIESGAVGRIVHGDDGVLEAGCLKCRLPVLDSLLDSLPPFVRECRVHIEYDRILRFNQFPVEIFLHILGLWLESPAVDDALYINSVSI